MLLLADGSSVGVYCVVFPAVCQALGYRSVGSAAITKVHSGIFSVSGQTRDHPVLLQALQVSAACFCIWSGTCPQIIVVLGHQ